MVQASAPTCGKAGHQGRHFIRANPARNQMMLGAGGFALGQVR